MLTNEAVEEMSYPFLSLDGKEFTAGAMSVSENGRSVTQFRHLAGKTFEDVSLDLNTGLTGPETLVQIPAAITLLDMTGIQDADELVSHMSRASGLSADNLLVACLDRTKGTLTDLNNTNALAVGVNKTLVYSRMADARALGMTNPVVTVRALNAIGAIKAALAGRLLPEPVLCVCVMESSSLFFVVSEGNVEDLGPTSVGYTETLQLIMEELGLKFSASAARLFFDEIYDFSDKGESLSAALGSKIRAKMEAYKGIHPKELFVCGLPPTRAALFTRHVAAHLDVHGIDMQTALDSGKLESAPAALTLELSHLLSSYTKQSRPGFFVDFAKFPADQCVLAEDPASHHGFVRMYRGTAIDEHGNPVTATPSHKSPSPNEKEHRNRKVVRMYRGTPVYEDEIR